ncbi:TetR/AcrR family transcriptional regulator [Pseudarthrobacter sp. MDT3-9]|nr:TetR/AcrR family transcriptional regulator [Pseudarthrobacter sp. MDT3-9]
MSDIARAVNVSAPAIYRHFQSKSELLVDAISSGLTPYTEILEARSDEPSGRRGLDFVLRQLAECALDHRQLGVLWQREARNLGEQDQKILRERLRATTRLLAGFLTVERPELEESPADLLAWCAMGALVSVGFHSLSLPREEYIQLLVDITQTLVSLPTPDTGSLSSDIAEITESSPSRREDLISEATELFAERGFGAVGVDDIGSAAGIAGPSIYSHFASKQTILAAAIQRGNDLLTKEAAPVLKSGEPPHVKLGRLVESYVRLALNDRFLIRILLSEMNQLAERDRDSARRQQRQYIDIWTDLFREYVKVDPVAARIRVQAVLLVVNDAVQTPHLRSQPGFEQTLRHLAGALLHIPQAQYMESTAVLRASL